MILVIDNYDSFVFNLARYFEQLGGEMLVVRNDEIAIEQMRELAPQAIVLSPGPCTPDQAGCSLEVVREFYRTVPLLGVCLGHQSIAQALGATVVRSPAPRHGMASTITHSGDGLFAGMPAQIDVGRYHSLCVDSGTLPNELKPMAWSDEGVLMAFEHRELPVFGLQFHPESILTRCGYQLIAAFMTRAGIPVAGDARALDMQLHPAPPSSRPLPTRPITF